MAPRKPNYRFERQERERLKAEKKAEKAARRQTTAEPEREEGTGETRTEDKPEA